LRIGNVSVDKAILNENGIVGNRIRAYKAIHVLLKFASERLGTEASVGEVVGDIPHGFTARNQRIPVSIDWCAICNGLLNSQGLSWHCRLVLCNKPDTVLNSGRLERACCLNAGFFQGGTRFRIDQCSEQRQFGYPKDCFQIVPLPKVPL
jgi:hypothetical protein